MKREESSAAVKSSWQLFEKFWFLTSFDLQSKKTDILMNLTEKEELWKLNVLRQCQVIDTTATCATHLSLQTLSDSFLLLLLCLSNPRPGKH